MASIEHRPTKAGEDRWRVVWWEDGQRQQQTWPVLKRAEEFRKRVEGHGNHWPPGEDPRPHRSQIDLTFGQWARLAVEARPRANERTKVDYLRDLDRHFATLNTVPLAALDDTHVAAWEQDRREAGLAPKTIRNLHGFASSIMRDAIRTRPPRADHNPFDDRLTRTAAVRVEEMCFLTPPEFSVIAGHVREEYRPLIRLLFGTGLRFGEATALTVRDVDLLSKRKTLTVTKAWKRTGPAVYVVGEPKTPRSRRTLSIAPDLVDMLIPHVSARKGDELLFPGAGGGRLPHSEVYKRGWAPAVARSNVCQTHYAPQRDGRGNPPRLPKPCDCDGALGKVPRLHDLRHSHASVLISDGIPIGAVSRRLGHSSITITMDRYGHLDPVIDAQIDESTERSLTRH